MKPTRRERHAFHATLPTPQDLWVLNRHGRLLLADEAQPITAAQAAPVVFELTHGHVLTATALEVEL